MMKQPKYKFGELVAYEIKGQCQLSKEVLVETRFFPISHIKASGTSEKDSFEYGITADMPRCYHCGKHPFAWIYEDKIVTKEQHMKGREQ